MVLCLNNWVFASVLRQQGVLIQYVIEVCYFPSKLSLVVNRQYLEQVIPFHIGFKSNNILNVFFISASKED